MSESAEGVRVLGRVRCTLLRPSVGNAPLIGEAFARAVHDGQAWVDFDRHNLVVNIGLSAIAKFLGNNAAAPTVGGSTFADLEAITVDTMELGAAASPSEPTTGDTTGVSNLIYTPPLTVSYPDDYSVMFSGVLPVTEAIGTTVTEEALKLVNGKVFAKCIFSRVKTGSFGLQFDHTISFSRS